MTDRGRSIRLLHVVGNLDPGGVQTWLMHMLRTIDRERVRMDFLVHARRPGAHDEEVRQLGCRVIPSPTPSRPRLYARYLTTVLREQGPYDVVHSHVHHYSGYVLRLARRVGVPTRIAHSHVDRAAGDRITTGVPPFYRTLMTRWIRRHATAGLAASRESAAALFGERWAADPRWRVVHYVVDLAPFRAAPPRTAVCGELGLPPDAFVVGHVGRLCEQKNHAFLIEVAGEVLRREPKAHFLLVGDGALRREIEERVARAGLRSRFVFTGARPDVWRLMTGAMDVFVMPSRWEGLPLAGIEAQAAGLPLVLSDVITGELDVVRPLIARLPLSNGAAAWAEAIVTAREKRRAIEPAEALAMVEESSFNLSTHPFDALYLESSRYIH